MTIQLGVPLASNKILLVSILEKECENFPIYHFPLIIKASLIKPSEKEKRFQIITQGMNVQRIWRLAKKIDINDININDVVETCRLYGIEATKMAIINEVSFVFKAYGINVNYRHLALIADYMTFDGQLKAFNRTGLDTNASLLLKMSFETTLNYLKKSILMGEVDLLQSPSGAITVGNPPKVGTGIFEVKVDLSKLSQKSIKKRTKARSYKRQF